MKEPISIEITNLPQLLALHDALMKAIVAREKAADRAASPLKPETALMLSTTREVLDIVREATPEEHRAMLA